MSKIVVSHNVDPGQRAMYKSLFSSHDLYFLEDANGESGKQSTLSGVEVLLSWNPAKELEGIEGRTLERVRFIQLISAGFDHLNFDMFPRSCLIAANQGAYALPMAEHVLAMILASAKILRRYHTQVADGKFEQWKSFTRKITGSTLGVIGFGSIGKECVRLMRPFDIRVMGINTTGRSDQPVDFCGTLKDLHHVLSESDFIVVSIPLNHDTDGLIGRRELGMMKPDAILVNVARGPILKEKDLYEHLKSHPDFFACIDAWWIEPFKFGKFKINCPFFELPNLLGSPHNSTLVDGIMLEGTRRAAENAVRYLDGGNVKGLVTRSVSAAD